MLAACPVFDTFFDPASPWDPLGLFADQGGLDHVTVPGGATHGVSDCPAGVALAPGDALAWTSDSMWQGGATGVLLSQDQAHRFADCEAKGLCGLPGNPYDGLGGGWQLCFAGYGCTNPSAANFDPEAAVDDGSCG